MRYILIALTIFFIAGCSVKEIHTPVEFENVTIPEIITTPTKPNDLDLFIDEYLDKHYITWSLEELRYTKEQSTWGYRSYTKNRGYVQENLQPIEAEKFDKMLEFSNLEDYGNVSKLAITTQNTNLRIFPTNKPLFKITYDGSGYPFDLLQNSHVHIMSPVIISHYSKDRSWAFVETSFASGWIQSNHLSVVDKKNVEKIKDSKHIVIIKDNAPIYEDEIFISYANVGAILPIEKEDDNFFYLHLFDKNSKTFTAKIEKSFASSFPLSFNDLNAEQTMNELLNQPYGWGGLYENRDCSAMTKDFMSVFGVWLPRNSASQKNIGKFFNLSKFSIQEKNEIIKNFAVPYLSLVHLPGHIMLYVGHDDNNALVLHNIWGLKTIKDNKEGRYIIGKTVISDLFLGNNETYVDKNSALINRISGFNIIGSNSDILLAKLKLAYPQHIDYIKDNRVYFKDGSNMIFDDGYNKTYDELLNNADIEDMLILKYKKGAVLKTPETDPGRFRNEEFLKKIYGSTELEIKENLVEVVWLPKNIGKKYLFNKNNGAAKALQNVSNELDKLPSKFLPYLKNIGGTHNFRVVSNTNRLSAHSYGISIDINTNKSNYWLWDKEFKYKNSIPQEIVDIFEKHGFIWGGKWHHYDTMHFEFRPELF